MPEFRVIDLRQVVIVPEQVVVADTPEEAVHQVLGIRVNRKGHSRNLVARVYWQDREATKMVRLYASSVIPLAATQAK